MAHGAVVIRAREAPGRDHRVCHPSAGERSDGGGGSAGRRGPVAAGARVVPVWRNLLGGTTWRLDGGPAGAGVRYLRWSPPGAGPDLDGEVARLRWAAAWTPVPRVLDAGHAADGSAWLLTEGLPGRSAVDPGWRARSAEAALALGRGLRLLHDRLPVDGCPFDWGTAARSVDRPAAQALLPDEPPVDRLVVCHADACAPNTLLEDDGTGGVAVTGHVDLGRLGVADRWADLAPACWSADHNYGKGHADLVCRGYGVEPDRERLRWYLALWDADE